ncbi:MAG: YggU family protein [Deltaproteobacteria bacterium]|nr:YggU family protein [Deltaproteobacteria bacterium]
MVSIEERGDDVVFLVHVVPRSAKSEIAGIQDDALKIKVAAPPVEGQANAECVRLLSDVLGVKKNQVTIISGHRSKRKKVTIEGVKREDIESLLSKLM